MAKNKKKKKEVEKQYGNGIAPISLKQDKFSVETPQVQKQKNSVVDLGNTLSNVSNQILQGTNQQQPVQQPIQQTQKSGQYSYNPQKEKVVYGKDGTRNIVKKQYNKSGNEIATENSPVYYYNHNGILYKEELVSSKKKNGKESYTYKRNPVDNLAEKNEVLNNPNITIGKRNDRESVLKEFNNGYQFGDVTKTIGNTLTDYLLEPVQATGEAFEKDPVQTLKTMPISFLEGMNQSITKINDAASDFADWALGREGTKENSRRHYRVNQLVQSGTEKEKKNYLDELTVEYKSGDLDKKSYDLYKKMLTGKDTRSETVKKIDKVLDWNYEDTETYKKYQQGELDEGQQNVWNTFSQVGDQAIPLVASTVGSPAVGKALFWIQAQQGYTDEAKARGYTDENARKYGLIMGTVESLVEEMGFDQFAGLDKIAEENIVKAIMGESMEEFVTPYIDYYVRTKFGENYDLDSATNEAVEGAVSAAWTTLILNSAGKGMVKVDSVANKINNNKQVTTEDLLAAAKEIEKSNPSVKDEINKILYSLETNQQLQLTENENKVVEDVLEQRIKEEYNGEISNKEKKQLKKEIQEDLRKGYISTDTIEKSLGGETYTKLDELNKQQTKLQNQIEELEKKAKNNELSSLEEKQKLEDLKKQIKQIDNTQIKNQLTSEVQDIIKNDKGLRESYLENQRRGENFFVDLNTIKDEKQRVVYQKAMETGVLNNSNKTHALVDMIAKISSDKNIDFNFTNNEQLEKSGFGVNGRNINGYVTDSGITINLNSAKAINRIVGHELTHTFEGTTLYTELQDSLKDFLGSEWDNQVAKYKELYKGVKNANIENELTSDLIGDYLFTDENYVKNLSTKNKNLFEKIYDEIKYLYNVATAGSKEKRQLEKVKRTFDRIYNETESKTTTEDAKYMIEQIDKYDKNIYNSITKDEVADVTKQQWEVVRKELFNNARQFKPGLNEVNLSKNGSYLVYAKNKQDFKILEVLDEGENLYEAENLKRNVRENDQQEDNTIYFEDGKEQRRTNDSILEEQQEFDTNRYSNESKSVKTRELEKPSSFSLSEQNTKDKINQSMTMNEVKKMIDIAFKENQINDWREDNEKYLNADEWLEDVGVDEVATYVDNTQSTIMNYTNPLYDKDIGFGEDFTTEDILEAYKNGTLTGSEKQQANRLDLTKQADVTDNRFYSPQTINDINKVYDVANQRVNNSNREEVYKARGDFVILAHNQENVEKLGLDSKELNQTLKKWAAYSNKVLELSNRLNENVAENNKWSGLENSSILYTTSVSTEELNNLVKSIEGDSSNWQRNYITSTMLALDTHINYKNLAFEFDKAKELSEKNALGDYNRKNKTIRIGNAYQNTVAHEIGHYLDNTWAEDFGFFNTANMTDKLNFEATNLSDDAKQFAKNFNLFMDDLVKSATTDSYSNMAYWQDRSEVFARFVGRFVEWTKNTASDGRFGYENKYYKENFTQSQYEEFIKLLQEKSMLDTTGQTYNKVGDVEYSLSQDSEGRELTTQQQEYFKDETPELLDENGNLKQVYHGTNYDFTVFKNPERQFNEYASGKMFANTSISMFTDSQEVAQTYIDNQEFPNRKPMGVYLKMTHPYVVDANYQTNKYFIDNDGTPTNVNTLVKKIYDSGEYDGIVIKNIADLGNYEDYDVTDGRQYATDYIVFESNQVKDVNNLNPTENEDIRYSLNIAPISKNFLTQAEQDELDGLRSVENSGWAELTPEEQSRMYELENKADKVLNKKAEKMLRSASYKAINTTTKIAQNYLDFDANQKKEFRSQMREFSNMTKDELVNADTYNKVKDIVSQYANKEYTYFDDSVESLKRELKHTKIQVSDELKNQITDYGDFVKDSKLMLRRNSGQSVDKVYKEYSDMYPGFFDENVWNEADQLEALNDFANHDFSVTEKYKLTDEDLRNATDLIYNKLLDNSLTQQDLIETEEILDKKAQKRTRSVVREELLQKMGITPETIQAGNDISAISFARTDPIRVNEKVFGWETGQKINDATVNFTKHQEAERIRFLNKERQEIKDLGIKARSKESELVQKYGEKQYVDKNNEVHEYGDAELARDVQDVATREKIKNAARVLRQKYDTYIDRVNSVLTEMGYDEIPKRKDYMRHFVELDDKFSRWGLPFNKESMMAEDLPTDINGLTEFNRPGKSYFASANTRTGLQTTYDAITGIDGYLEGVSNLIYHTESIQRYRALSRLIRESYGREHGLDNIDLMTDEELADRIKDIQDNKLSKYAAWLDEQANSIAGKKGALDRSVERMFGRRIYTALNTLKSQVGSNMTGFNVRSAMTNFASAIQGMSKTQKLAFVKGTVSTINNIIHNDGMIEKSDFLTRRLLNTDSLAMKPWQKLTQAGQVFMNGTDYFTANQIWRSKYYENLQKGMSEEQAIKNADDFAARIMGDRSKGSTAELFNSKTLGFLSQFQLEVNNQWSSLIHDNKIDIQKGNKTPLGVTFELGQLFGASYLFNTMMKSLTGSDVMIDPIDMLLKIFKPDDDDEDDIVKRAQKVLGEFINQLPFANLITGGGRIPISEAFTGADTLRKKLTGGTDNYGNEITWGDVSDDLKESLAYWVLPTGYGQIRKTVKGLSMYDDKLPVAGSYTDSGNLRFSAEDTPFGKIKAGLFGQYSSKYAQDYIKSGYKSINASKLDEMKDLDMNSTEYRNYREGLSAAGTSVEDKLDYINSLDVPYADKDIMASNVAKKDIDMKEYNKYGSYEEFNYAQKNPAKYQVMKYVGGYDTYKNYEKEINDIKADYDRNGKAITNSRKNKVIKYVNSLNLTKAQKAMLIKEQYPSFTKYDKEIASYINSQDIRYIEKASILKQLGFTAYDRQIINYIKQNYRTVEEQQEELEKLGFKVYNYNGKTYVR